MNFMSDTYDILLKMKNCIKSGSLEISQIPISDVKECVLSELQICKKTYIDLQYTQVESIYNDLCGYVNDGEEDITKINMFIDGMLMCLLTVSQAVKSLINKDYWMYKHMDRIGDPELCEIIDHIDKRHDVRLLNYDFVDNYRPELYEVRYDDKCGMVYIPYKGRKMYFPKGWSEMTALDYFCSVISEQNECSPHCYFKKGYEVKEGSVIVDVGAAEGLFSLDYIDKAQKVYLIDADMQWIEALRKTFENDLDKAEIIYGYVGSLNDGKDYISLDGILCDEKVDFIKMDIEGYEMEALAGAKKVLTLNRQITCAICAYHNSNDESRIKAYLSEKGFTNDVSRGYIFPDWIAGSVLTAELRRGIVFGKKWLEI